MRVSRRACLTIVLLRWRKTSSCSCAGSSFEIFSGLSPLVTWCTPCKGIGVWGRAGYASSGHRPGYGVCGVWPAGGGPSIGVLGYGVWIAQEAHFSSFCLKKFRALRARFTKENATTRTRAVIMGYGVLPCPGYGVWPASGRSLPPGYGVWPPAACPEVPGYGVWPAGGGGDGPGYGVWRLAIPLAWGQQHQKLSICV